MGYGVERLQSQIGKREISKLGVEVADLLDDVFLGIYHLPYSTLAKADWSDDYFIRLSIYGGLSTWDYDYLTRLVVFAHDMMIRVEVNPCNFNYIELVFHKRKTRDIHNITQSMPTIEEHIELIRKYRGKHN